MTLSEDESSALLSWPYTQSPFDGDLKAELRTWGYLDDDTVHEQSDAQCDFDSWHHVNRAFAALSVDTRSKGMGGENHCFFVRHADGPAVIKGQDGTVGPPEEQRYIVDGKTYKITNAYSRIGINRKAGIVYFLHRKSPEHAAAELWGLDPDTTPDAAELPKIRASSDLAWGLWNRVPGEDVKHITMFMAFGIVNDDTASVIIPRALQAAGVDEVDKWPGTDFVVGEGGAEMEEATMALIGTLFTTSIQFNATGLKPKIQTVLTIYVMQDPQTVLEQDISSSSTKGSLAAQSPSARSRCSRATTSLIPRIQTSSSMLMLLLPL
ncbi:hypothetical protein J1614_000789 [Plenodomus biglobosus]|nr:hypothetical protein J1614_000789 [Plenodomus biglobosus]